jgi:hypothetical protein
MQEQLYGRRRDGFGNILHTRQSAYVPATASKVPRDVAGPFLRIYRQPNGTSPIVSLSPFSPASARAIASPAQHT